MVSNAKDKNLPNPLDDGFTPLHEAAKAGHLDICKLITENLEDKNPPDDDGWTVLHDAADRGDEEVYRLIMNLVEDKNPATG